MRGSHRENVYAACRGYVVVLVLGDLVTRSHSVRCSSIQGDEISCIRDHLNWFIVRFIILMIRSPVQDVCTLVRLNFV